MEDTEAAVEEHKVHKKLNETGGFVSITLEHINEHLDVFFLCRHLNKESQNSKNNYDIIRLPFKSTENVVNSARLALRAYSYSSTTALAFSIPSAFPSACDACISFSIFLN